MVLSPSSHKKDSPEGGPCRDVRLLLWALRCVFCRRFPASPALGEGSRKSALPSGLPESDASVRTGLRWRDRPAPYSALASVNPAQYPEDRLEWARPDDEERDDRSCRSPRRPERCRRRRGPPRRPLDDPREGRAEDPLDPSTSR
ncbi:uncharacterized protein LOC143824707 [Paroedura picta]|uniref:uncharacterized protein LOC143824707 n=1 Tax=Paroedura picta TaxID=143630 RepID=UPI0040579902